jgi:hypothetical protein
LGWITETNYLTAAKLNWAPIKTNIDDFINGYLRNVYGDAQEDIFESLNLSQIVWEEFCPDFDGICMFKDYYHITWMHGLDTLRNTSQEELAINIGRIKRHSQMMAQALYLLETGREKVNPLAMPAFEDLVIQTKIFTEFFTSRLLLAQAFMHRYKNEKERMKNKLRMVYSADERIINLALSKPNISDYFEMEGMTIPTNYVKGYLYLTMVAAWDFLQNRMFEEMAELEQMINE